MNGKYHARCAAKLAAAILLAALCVMLTLTQLKSTSGPAQRTTATSVALPLRWNANHRDPLVDATQVWRLGEAYLAEEPVELPPEDPTSLDKVVSAEDLLTDDDIGFTNGFTGIDGRTLHFLNWPRLQPAVQFGCVGHITPYEDSLVKALQTGTPELKLQALAILMRVRAPSSVQLQHDTLCELRQLTNRLEWQPLLTEMQELFRVDRVEAEIDRSPPTEQYSSRPHNFFWNIRAAGVLHDKRMLERLTELSRWDHLHTSLDAERSLEDYTGPEAEAALARCYLGWQDAHERAGFALLKRNKAHFITILLAAKPPSNCRYRHGLFLAECDVPEAVPILCQEVRSYQMIDQKMFQEIARLGRSEDAAMIDQLPDNVRPEQRQMAEQAVIDFRKRVK